MTGREVNKKTEPGDKPSKQKKRNHTAKQLIERPATAETSDGPVTVGAKVVRGVVTVEISYPSGVVVVQPPPVGHS